VRRLFCRFSKRCATTGASSAKRRQKSGPAVLIITLRIPVIATHAAVDSTHSPMYFHALIAEVTMVVKLIARFTYWLGLVCGILAVITRLANALGFESMRVMTRGNPFDFRSFLDAALLLIFASMASSLYARIDS